MSALLLSLLISSCGGSGAVGDDAEALQIRQSQPTAGQALYSSSAATQIPASDTDKQSAIDAFAPGDAVPDAAEGALAALAPLEADPQSGMASGVPVASTQGEEAVDIAAQRAVVGSRASMANDVATQPALALMVAQANAPKSSATALSSLNSTPANQTSPQTESSADILADPSRGIVAPDRLAREDWTGMAARIGQAPDVAKFVADQRRLADAWAARGRERADLVGGWIHDYVDPRTGIPLVWKEDTPEPPASTAPGEDRFKEAWVTYVRYRNISYTLTAARIFRATGERAYADWAMRQLDFYANNYEGWPLRTVDGRSRMFREGLAEATNVFTLLEAARLIGDFASSQREQQWAAHLFGPIAENLKSMTYPMSNVGLWHQAAIAAIGMRLRDEGLIQYALNNPQGIRAIMAYGVTPDFLWIEGTFSYNAYVIECLAKLLSHASLEGYASHFAPEWLAARRLLLSPIDYRFDNGWLPRPSDAIQPLKAVDPATHRLLYRLVPSYWGVERARSELSWEALVDPPLGFPGGEPSWPAPSTRNFPSVRMAVLRTGEWQAFVHYGQAVGSHAQEEALNFELHHGKTPISTDPGTVVYASPYHTRYFRRAAAHNVPLIDGVGQARWRPGAIEAFNQANSRLVVAQPDYNPAAAVEREYHVTGSGLTTTTHVTLKGSAPQPARIGEAFHTDCAIGPSEGLSPAADGQLPSADAMTFWTVQSLLSASNTWSVTLKCSQADYRLRVTASGVLRVFFATAPTTPLPNRRNVIYYDTMAISALYQTEITALP